MDTCSHVQSAASLTLEAEVVGSLWKLRWSEVGPVERYGVPTIQAKTQLALERGSGVMI
ncbi:hypothetical protein ACFL5O_12200 [Myxococcota bacterium]